MVLDAELVTFFESGLSIMIGTASRRLAPSCMRGIAVRVDPDREHVRVYVADATSARVLSDLRENNRVAVTFNRPTTHKGVQVKGPLISVTPGDPEVIPLLEKQRAGLVEELEAIGLSRSLTWRLALAPFHEIRMKVEEVFVQTPGPGAGKRLGA